MGTDERQYTLQELATTAGVSIRTIRYYIGEGLLPVPEGAGPQSHYTDSHLNRLRAIGLLKDRYLPLKEIRKALSGLDDAEIETLIADLDDGVALASPEEDEARGNEMYAPAQAAFVAEAAAPVYDALSYIDSALEQGRPKLARIRRSARVDQPQLRSETETWRRIVVAPGVELLVSDDLYQRRHEQIDWLVDWARKVVD